MTSTMQPIDLTAPPRARQRPRRRSRAGRVVFALAALLVIGGGAAAGYYYLWGKPQSEAMPAAGDAVAVRRGNLVISVTESGNLKALREEIVKSEVEGTVRIMSIVPEGIYITAEDVANHKILVELESSTLREKLTQQEITFAAAEATYTQAREGYDIQVKQNESNIKAGELQVLFAGIDIQHYLGETLAPRVLKDATDPNRLINDADLGGAALQQLRKLESDISLAREEMTRQASRLAQTKKLYEAGYVSKEDYDADDLAYKRDVVALDQTTTALDLFRRYEFAKQVMTLRAAVDENAREIDRIKAKARSELAQADAERRSKQAAYLLQKERLQMLQQQVEKCTLRARKPGLVVYANRDWRGRVRYAIEEGAEIRERQAIINLPDLSSMGCDVDIHESSIRKVKEGQRCVITVDAMPDLGLSGAVKSVSVIPSTQNWLNPNLKTYATEVTIDGSHPSLKPGMQARVEIISDDLRDVLYVPAQAIFSRGAHHYCYTPRTDGLAVVPVVIGQSNDKFTVITSGLKEGDRVLLYAPPGAPPLPAEPAKKTEEKPVEVAPPAEDPPPPAAAETKPAGGERRGNSSGHRRTARPQ